MVLWTLEQWGVSLLGEKKHSFFAAGKQLKEQPQQNRLFLRLSKNILIFDPSLIEINYILIFLSRGNLEIIIKPFFLAFPKAIKPPLCGSVYRRGNLFELPAIFPAFPSALSLGGKHEEFPLPPGR